MKFDAALIREFQELYKEEYGENLNEQIARECLVNLVSIFKVIYKPIPKNEMRKDEKAATIHSHTT